MTNYIKSTYTQSVEDLDVLCEMIVKVLAIEDYKEIANKEIIYALKPHVNRFNVSNSIRFTIMRYM